MFVMVVFAGEARRAAGVHVLPALRGKDHHRRHQSQGIKSQGYQRPLRLTALLLHSLSFEYYGRGDSRKRLSVVIYKYL